MSTTASSDGEYEEPDYLQENFQSGQPVQAAERASQPRLKREGDAEEAKLLDISPNVIQPDSDSDEYVLSPVKTQRKGKERASETANQPSLEESAEAGTHYDRPNRFYGPPSTWLSWTQSERETIKSLDQERAENLSAHLYVAHRMKKHARSVQRSNLRREKRRASSADSEGKKGAGKPFMPPKVWTTWPMPPEQVPRVFHTTGILDQDDPFTIRPPRDMRPSAELEECIIATITRTARERFRAREWEDGNASDGDVADWDPARSKLDSSQQTSAPQHSHAKRDSSSPPIFFSSQLAAQHSSSPSPPPQSRDRSPQSPNPGSHSSSRSRSRSPPQPLPSHASLHPVPLADDDRAHTLLLPATRHLIAKVDDLLLGLHRARRAYVGAGGAQDGDETQTATETEGSRSKSRSRGRKRRRKVGRTTTTTLEDEKPGTDTKIRRLSEGGFGSSGPRSSPPDSKSNSNPSPRKRNRNTSHSTPQEVKPSRLGLRGWTDLLGMAALTGWDRRVVMRAGKRCARLFGEDMGFRTFHLGGGFEEGLVGWRWYIGGEEGHGGEGEEGEDEEGDGEEDEDEDEEEERVDFMQADVMDTEEDSDYDDNDISTTAPSIEDDATDPHYYSISPSPSPPPPSAAAVTAPATATATATNATIPNKSRPLHQQHLHLHNNHHHHHQDPLSTAADEEPVNEIYCPLATCPRHQDPFSRGNLLYKHVRRMHPEVDLGRVKEGEKRRRSESRRGEGEKRRRSESRRGEGKRGRGRGIHKRTGRRPEEQSAG